MCWSAFMFAYLFSQRRAIVKELRALPGTPQSCGFLSLDSGAWLWAVPPVALDGGGRLGGALVRISRVIGLPFVRLRTALPAEMFRGSLLHAVGRKDALSVEALLAEKKASKYAWAVGAAGGSVNARLTAPLPRCSGSKREQAAASPCHLHLRRSRAAPPAVRG